MRVARSVAAVFFGVSLCASINHGIATRDLLVDAVGWWRAMAHRYELVAKAARVEGPAAEVIVAPVVHPSTFTGNSISGLTPTSQATVSLRRTSGSDQFA